MTNSFKKEKERILERLASLDPESTEYQQLLKTYITVQECDGTVNNDLIVSILGKTIGLLLVLNFEKVGIITSRAFGMAERM